MAFFACSPEPKSPFAPISPVTPNAVTTQQFENLHHRVQFLTRKLQEAVESRDYYANLYYSTKRKLETTRSSLHYVMQHLKFIGNQVSTVASQVEGDNIKHHKTSHYIVEPSTIPSTIPLASPSTIPLASPPVKRPDLLNVVQTDSIPSKENSSSLQRNRRAATPSSPKSTTTGSTGERSDQSSPPNLEYKSYKGISSNEFIELCQQLSDPNCPFSYLQLTNCRMGSVEVMETFCYNLSKNTSLVELSLTNVGIKQDSLVVLLKGLQKLENIRVLRLQYNKIGEECCDVLKTFVTKTHLMFLDLKGNPVEDSGGKKELEMLCSHPGRCIIKFHDKPNGSDEENATQL